MADSRQLPPARSRGHALVGAGGLWLGAAAAATLGATLGVRLAGLARIAGRSQVDGLVELGVVAAGVAVLAWLATSCAVAAGCLSARAVGGGWRRGEAWVHRWAPVVVRRAVVLAVGAGLGLSAATGASASDATPLASPVPSTTATADATGARDLGCVPTDRAPSEAGGAATAAPNGSPSEPGATPQPYAAAAVAGTPGSARAAEDPAAGRADSGRTAKDGPAGTTATGSSQTPATARVVSSPASTPGADTRATPTRGNPGGTPEGTVTVAPGDTLWTIAARHLPNGADDAQIAAAWPVWYATNAVTIGSDPDVIQPGQLLHVPTDLEGAAS